MFSYLRLFLLPLLLLLLVAQTEKGLFVIYHAEQFNALGLADTLYAMLWGIRFDLAIAGAFAFMAYSGAYLLQRLLGIRLQTGLRHTSFIAAAALLMLHGADMLYYGEAGRHLGYELKEGINSGSDLATAALQSYTLPVALQMLLLLPLYLGNRFLFSRIAPPANEKNLFSQQRSSRLGGELALAILLLFSAVMVRGGVGSVPLEPLHAQEIGDSRSATVALNGVYNAVFSSLTPYSIRPVFAQSPTETELEQVRGMYADRLAVAGEARPYNVIMILLESWSGAYQQSYGYDRQTTPFFDALRQRSLTTMAMTAGGHRTTEGLFASLCSWQNPLGQTVAQSQLQNYHYRCLPEVFDEHNYHTAFFQGTLKNTSGTGAFAQLLGFKHSYGKEDVAEFRYPHNSWGLQDPDLYRYVLQQLKQMPQPFFVGINTNSTHSSELPPGVAPHFSGEGKETTYINVLHFSDAALRDFIESVENDQDFQDTVFVLVADHAGPGRSGSALDNYLVPFLIYAPDLLEPQQLGIVSSQRDIPPTLLSLLHINASTSFSGKSLLGNTDSHFADYYHQGTLGWIEGKRGIEFQIGERQEMNCYELLENPLRRQAGNCSESDQARHRRALAFTHLSQSLLFNGKVDSFSPLRADE